MVDVGYILFGDTPNCYLFIMQYKNICRGPSARSYICIVFIFNSIVERNEMALFAGDCWEYKDLAIISESDVIISEQYVDVLVLTLANFSLNYYH